MRPKNSLGYFFLGCVIGLVVNGGVIGRALVMVLGD